ncbi:hypothetical protein C2845_PM08G10750 [Panicum miliaceum]|uniref:Acyl transferase 4-like n=1 Tax=Panicum miliaceum TaxID=4540 RepID=A0A3L6QZB4_PANMI|nr:hypothetical protein C2845_PM08G10750 [Panicum miliaceum]
MESTVRRTSSPEQQRNSPARVVREALGKALVDYYPFAGRFVDGAGGPASARVECTGEGAWFVEAAAACGLEDVACLDHHPLAIPAEDLLPDVASGVQPLDIPLMMQVTEFTCGGFVVGLSSRHALTDGLGAGQFINAVGDYARGLPKPRVSPTWARDLVPNPPKLHLAPPSDPPTFQFRYLTVDLSIGSVSAVKSQFHAATGQRCSSFDVAVAKVWQARTRSLRFPDPSARVALCFFADARRLLPKAPGFYGNCFYPVTLAAEAGAVARADVAGVVGMVRGAKARLAAEFARWAAGELVGEEEPYALWLRREPPFVSDWRQLGFLEADYGRGAPSHVAPLATLRFMPVALIVTPPAPRTGVRVTTRCVEEEHMPAFREEMKAFEE